MKMLEQKIHQINTPLRNTHSLASYAFAIFISFGGASGCAATPTIIPRQDAQTKIWYDCRSDTNYPESHPCFSVIEQYNAAKMASSRPYKTKSAEDYTDRGDRSMGVEKGKW